MAITPISGAATGSHPPQDEPKKSGDTPVPPRRQQTTTEAARGPHPPQDQP
jgi:hypothetical protein